MELKNKLEEVQRRLQESDLDFMERMDLKDEELSLKQQLNLLQPIEDPEECESCSA